MRKSGRLIGLAPIAFALVALSGLLSGCDFNINLNSTSSSISGSASPSSSPSPSPSPSVAQVSASGTTIPSASQIIDSSYDVWTVADGVVLENGEDAGYSSNVILLLYYNGVIYQENSSESWWSWTDDNWLAVSGDPRTSSGGSGNGSGSGSSGFSFNSAGSSPDDYNIGMNLPSLDYYNNAPIYADITYQMAGNYGPWDNTTNSGAAPLDSTGAPTTAAASGFTADYPSGQYTLSWDGTGSIAVSGATMGTPVVTTSGGVQHNVVTVTLTANPSATGENWTQVKATPPVTNIHFMVPASEQVSGAGSIFEKDFLSKIAPFSTFRFMDALNTNGNLVENWSQRTWPTQGSRAGTAQGMAYEDIIALANETGKDVWINIPVLATDDYVCRLARLFRYGESGSDDNGSNCSTTAASSAPAGSVALNSTSHVYVEFSNEVWNWGFQQVSDIFCMANGAPASYSCTVNGAASTCYHTCDVTAPPSLVAQAALADGALPWSGAAGSTNYARGTEMSVVLTKRDNDIFKEVFGSQASQVKTVMNVQAAYAAEIDQGFQFMQQGYGSLTGYIDYMAVAPYFDIDSDTYADSLNDLFADLGDVLMATNPNGAGNSIYQWILGDLSEAGKYGLPLVAYEGGEGLSGDSNATYQANEMAAQFDPRMFTLTQQYFSVWDQLVGRSHLFNYFDFADGYGTYGMWGALVNATDPGSQKFDALLDLILTPGDANMDGTVDQSDCAIAQANYGKSGMFWSEGDFNHDGVVNAEDLAILNQHITGTPCAAP